jgi:hypothetical protein
MAVGGYTGAHLRRGHLRFLRTESNAQNIDEAHSTGELHLQRAKQTFELDADGGAMEVTLNPWLRGRYVKGFETREASPEEAVLLWTIAIAFLFLLFDPFPSDIGDYAERDHPHPAVRLFHVFLQAQHVAQSVSVAAGRSFERAWWQGLMEVGVASTELEEVSHRAANSRT